MSPEDIATAFSRHRFADAYPALHEDLRWRLVGGPVLEGRAVAIEACEGTLAGLVDTTTTFSHFRTIVGPDAVAVDSIADYAPAGGPVVRVASCDLYTFVGDQVVEITSYTVELPVD